MAANIGSSAGGPTLRDKVSMRGMRGFIARRMVESLQTMAQLTLQLEVDARPLVDFRGRLRTEGGGSEYSYNDLVLLAVARTLPDHPHLNATVDQETIYRWSSINLGVAVALDDGLMVPVIRECQDRSLPQLASEVHRLAERVRSRTIAPEDVLDGTFTITNLGMYGVDSFTPIINPPQVAILGIGRIRAEASVTLCLTIDHRAVDGALGARFLAALKAALENPERLRV